MIERETEEVSAKCSCGKTVNAKLTVIEQNSGQEGKFVFCHCGTQVWVEYPKPKSNLQPRKD